MNYIHIYKLIFNELHIKINTLEVHIMYRMHCECSLNIIYCISLYIFIKFVVIHE